MRGSTFRTEKAYYEKTKTRDLALITLLLGTGIRVSECVGLDVEDLDFKNDAVKVTRKGRNEMFVYFGEEVEKALLDYLEVRETVTPVAGHEHALFYSIQRKRMGVQAVENLVKKYAQHITSTKKITPHKLRSTYGTALYRETGDIYLVADVLGHKDVNTTRKHYASVGDDSVGKQPLHYDYGKNRHRNNKYICNITKMDSDRLFGSAHFLYLHFYSKPSMSHISPASAVVLNYFSSIIFLFFLFFMQMQHHPKVS